MKWLMFRVRDKHTSAFYFLLTLAYMMDEVVNPVNRRVEVRGTLVHRSAVVLGKYSSLN
jgi:hypothetical protein